MAEEETPTKKKFPFLVLFTVLNVLIVFGALGFVTWRFFFFERQKLDEIAERQRIAQEEKQRARESALVSFNPIRINVSSEDGRLRYLEVKIEFETNQMGSNWVERYRPQIKDKIIELAAKKNYEELRTVQGKLFLKNQITRYVNETLDPHDVKVDQVHFTRYLLQ
jgi:flagellar basal body-associated protein FliL